MRNYSPAGHEGEYSRRNLPSYLVGREVAKMISILLFGHAESDTKDHNELAGHL